MQVLENHPEAPADLREKSLRLAGRLIECSPGCAVATATAWPATFDSGRALAKMQAIIAAQGSKGFDPRHLSLGSLTLECAGGHHRRGGRGGQPATGPHCAVGRGPCCTRCGVDLLRRLGDAVFEGDPLYRVHAVYAADLAFGGRCLRARQRLLHWHRRSTAPGVCGILKERLISMTTPCLLHFPEDAEVACRAAAHGGFKSCVIERHRFPDGELRLRLPEILPARAVVWRSLSDPNEKLVELLFGGANRAPAMRAI
ncbi:MAG: hypothetical protein R3E42_01245 [Burkholderiaceae bacterium]